VTLSLQVSLEVKVSPDEPARRADDGTMVNQNQAEFASDEFRLGDFADDVSLAGVVPTLDTTWGRLKARFR